MPDLVGEVTAEETAYLLCSGILAVEKSTRGEIVGLPVDRELPVGDEDLVRVVLGIAKACEYLFGRGISRRLRLQQRLHPFARILFTRARVYSPTDG